MNKVIADRVFATLLLVFTLVFLLMASQMGSVPARMPLIVGSFTLILLIAYFIGEFWPKKAKAQPKKKPALEDDELAEVPDKDALNWYDIRVWGWLLVLFACIYLFGLAIGIGVLTAIFYRYAAKQSWRGGVIFGILQAAFLYGIFEVVFLTALYKGWIWETVVAALGG